MEKCNCDKFSNPLKTIEDVKARCASDIARELSPFLKEVTKKPGGWGALYQRQVCKKYWVSEYPFGEMHGGGFPCFYTVEVNDPVKYFDEPCNLTYKLRQEQEDRKFINSLKEVGPETCAHEGCTRKRVRFGIMCSIHHFEMIKKRNVTHI